MSRRVAVVGAGAAGLTAALRAAERGARVVLLNAHPKIGLKILMSGGTRCNVTHREVTERDFNGGSRPFVKRILKAFTPEETRRWFESLGVELKLEETGKYFPVTDEARTVLDALLRAVERAGVEIRAGARVIRIVNCGVAETASGGGTVPSSGAAALSRVGGPRFRLGIQKVTDSAGFSPAVSGYGRSAWPLPADEPGEWLETDALVMASGGLSFPRTGSDGTGYALVTALGHSMEPPMPALTPLTADDSLCRRAQGLTCDAELSLWIDGRRRTVIRGSLLVTHFGYSGPAALDMSRHWLRSEGAERKLTMSFLPGTRREEALANWLESIDEDPRSMVRRYLGHRLPDRLVVELCREAEVDPSAALAQIDRARRAALIERLVERPVPLTGTLGYEKAEVTAGGVRLREVDPSTLESRIVPGLFLCGEILDVEGRLGGFNFQWSWSSGTVAGWAVAK